jgi:hypothetical protein
MTPFWKEHQLGLHQKKKELKKRAHDLENQDAS